MSAAALLDRLDCVRLTGPSKWLALCPAHRDRNPSLSIRETDGGVVLVKCWTGCSAAEIVGAVGLDLSALFPPRESTGKALPRSERPRLGSRDLLELIGHPVTVVWLAACDMGAGKVLGEADREVVKHAAAKLARVVDEVRNGH